MTASLQEKAYENTAVLYMALELSTKKWRLAFSDGTKRRQVSIGAGNIAALVEQVGKARAKWGLSESCRVVSCYEAGRDGFWIHRKLEALGIENRVVDAASIEVSRRRRRAWHRSMPRRRMGSGWPCPDPGDRLLCLSHVRVL